MRTHQPAVLLCTALDQHQRLSALDVDLYAVGKVVDHLLGSVLSRVEAPAQSEVCLGCTARAQHARCGHPGTHVRDSSFKGGLHKG